MRALKSGSSGEFAAEELGSLEGVSQYRRPAKSYSDPGSSRDWLLQDAVLKRLSTYPRKLDLTKSQNAHAAGLSGASFGQASRIR